MKRLLVFVFVGILFQGCISLHNGVIAPNSVDVSTDNFQIIKTIDGKATAGYFLGLGGGGRKGLVKEAKRDMYKNHPPLPNEMITNITVDDKKLFFLGGLYIEHTVFVSADVVRFGEYVNKTDKSSSLNLKPKSNDINSSAQENIEKEIENKTIIQDNDSNAKKGEFSKINMKPNVGDVLYFEDFYNPESKIQGKVSRVSKSNWVTLEYLDKKGRTKTKNIAFNLLYKKN